MKIRLFAIAMLAVVIGFGACGGKEDKKSSDNAIKSFKVSGVAYELQADNVTFYHIYNKVSPGVWSGEPVWKVAPTIELSSPKATISPSASTPQDFVKETVTYTVTAEDGSTKVYKVHAERGQ